VRNRWPKKSPETETPERRQLEKTETSGQPSPNNAKGRKPTIGSRSEKNCSLERKGTRESKRRPVTELLRLLEAQDPAGLRIIFNYHKEDL